MGGNRRSTAMPRSRRSAEHSPGRWSMNVQEPMMVRCMCAVMSRINRAVTVSLRDEADRYPGASARTAARRPEGEPRRYRAQGRHRGPGFQLIDRGRNNRRAPWVRAEFLGAALRAAPDSVDRDHACTIAAASCVADSPTGPLADHHQRVAAGRGSLAEGRAVGRAGAAGDRGNPPLEGERLRERHQGRRGETS